MRKGIYVGILLGFLFIAATKATASFTMFPPLQGHAMTPRMSLGPQGHVYLVWGEERDGRAHNIYFNRSTDGGNTWQAESRWLDRDKPPSSRSFGPQVANDGKGGVFVTWRTKHQGGNKDVLIAVSKDFGATFEPMVKLNNKDDAFAPELSVNGQGHVYVIWSDERTESGDQNHRRSQNTHHIYLNRSEDGGVSWLPQDVKLNDGDEPSSTVVMRAWPRIQSDNNGHISTIWFDTRDEWAAIYAKASDDFGQTWQEEHRVKTAVQGTVLGPLQMVRDGRGHVYVAWMDNRDGAFGIYLAVSADFGKTWTPEVRLDTAKAKTLPAVAPALACDTSGHVYVVWQDARHGGWDIYLNMSSDFGKTWHTEEVRLNTDPAGESEAMFPQIALDGKGRVAVAWQENRGSEQLEGIYLTQSVDFGKSWAPMDSRVNDSQGTGATAFKPQIAVLQDGALLIAWEAQQRDLRNISLRMLRPGTLQTLAR